VLSHSPLFPNYGTFLLFGLPNVLFSLMSFLSQLSENTWQFRLPGPQNNIFAFPALRSLLARSPFSVMGPISGTKWSPVAFRLLPIQVFPSVVLLGLFLLPIPPPDIRSSFFGGDLVSCFLNLVRLIDSLLHGPFSLFLVLQVLLQDLSFFPDKAAFFRFKVPPRSLM